MLSTCSYASMLYIWPYFYVIGLCHYPFVADEETEGETKDNFLGCPAAAYRQTPTIRLHQKLASREPDIYRMCSLPLLHFVLFLRKRQSRIKWADTIFFFFFLKKSKFQRLLWGQYGFSFQSSLLLDPQAVKWKLTLKLVTPRQDPQPENSARVRPAAAYLPGPESRLKRITEIYLQELKAKGFFFFLI